MKDLTTRIPVLAACCFFILAGAAIIPYAGVQNDEALFGNPLYLLNARDLSINIFHRWIPLMIMSYVGTLKTLLYIPILGVFPSTVWTVRLPMVLVGAVTILFFYHLTKRIAGPAAALIGTLLLSTDASFLLTDTLDWGPVALQEFLVVTGCLLLVRFGEEGCTKSAYLAAGFLLLGLAVWNKALAFWTLGGLFVATLVVLLPSAGKGVRRAFGGTNVAIAVAAFLAGALPFIIYNVRSPNATLRSNAHLEIAGMDGKLRVARATLDGSGLLGFMTTPDWAEHSRTPVSIRGRAATWIHDRFGEHNRNGMAYAFGLALLAAPWWWRSRAAWFSLVFTAVSWLLMALTHDAGGAVHHAVLLWPFPHLFIAIALASLFSRKWGRPLTVVAVTVLLSLNLLVINQYIYAFDRNGAEGNFTDALTALSQAFPDPPDRASARPIYVVDWGMLHTLALFHKGKLDLRVGDDVFATDAPNEFQQKVIQTMLADRDAVFVGHVPNREVTEGVGRRIGAAAAAAGVRKELVRTIADSNGRPVFEIFRFVPNG